MPDKVCSTDAKLVEHIYDIGQQMWHRVGSDVVRFVGAAVAAQVRDNHPEAGIAQCRDLMTPQSAAVRKAVQQNQWPAITGDVVVDADTGLLCSHVNLHS
jgi:hypothetical protein